jgi:hypothetical protein
MKSRMKSKGTDGFHFLIGLEVRFGLNHTGLDKMGENTNSMEMSGFGLHLGIVKKE